MSEQQVHVFVPSMDGEYVPVTFTSPEEDLRDSEVLIFVNDEDRQIFIWTGSNSNVRKRFISSQIARQMRMEKGLTHRVSTEEQGNETARFRDFMNSLSGKRIEAEALLEVSPPSFSTDLPDPQPAQVITHPSTLKKVASTKSKFIDEKTISAIEAPLPPSAPEPKVEQLAAPIKPKRLDKTYFHREENTMVTETKAKILFQASNEDFVMSTLHISTASQGGRIAFYSVPKKTKTTSCKTAKPILVIYIKPDASSIMALDDLSIPIPAGNSIYFTCPDKTFIGLNMEQ